MVIPIVRNTGAHICEDETVTRSLGIAACLVAIATMRIVATYHVFSFTIDEPGHFACGMEYLGKHVYRYETQHPPLARAAIALLPYLSGIRPLGDANRNIEGRELILRSARPNHTLALMRLGVLPFFWLACWIVYAWSRQQCGEAVAVMAVALFTLLPPVLAHAGLASTDMALAACTGAAFYALILWAESPTWRRAVVLGFATALAVLAKFTALLYLPCAAVLAALFWIAAERPAWPRLMTLVRERRASLAIAALVTATVIWAGYWFSFGKVPAWNLSLPAWEFFDGLLTAQVHNRAGHPAYLLGQQSMHGWWYYFPVVLAVKTPIAFLLLALAGLRNASCRMPLALSLGILLPAMSGHVDIGVRLILPIYLGVSIVAAAGLLTLVRSRRRAAQTAAVLLIVWMAVAGALRHPDYLSYFNELASRDPSQILVDSDLDWGQDTKRLAGRLRELGVQDVSVMLIEPLTMQHPTEQALAHMFGLPRIQPVQPDRPSEGWTAVSPTVALTQDQPVKPWYLRVPPSERVGALWLYRK
jgi:hypothetical protein